MSDWDNYWSLDSLKSRLIENVRELYFSRIIAYAVRHPLDDLNGQRILEAGCGSGIVAKRIQDFIYIGCDYSKIALQRARQNSTNLVLCDLRDLPFKKNSFDIVFNQGVMEHFKQAYFLNILREFKRVSRKVLIIVPGNLSIFQLYDPFEDPDRTFFTKKSLKNILKYEFKTVTVRHMPEMFFLSICGMGEKNE